MYAKGSIQKVSVKGLAKRMRAGRSSPRACQMSHFATSARGGKTEERAEWQKKFEHQQTWIQLTCFTENRVTDCDMEVGYLGEKTWVRRQKEPKA